MMEKTSRNEDSRLDSATKLEKLDPNIYAKAYNLYIEMLELECLDITTEEFQSRKKEFLKRARVIVYVRSHGVHLPATALFKVYKFDEQRDDIFKELLVPRDPSLIKVRREIRDRGLVPHVFSNAKLSDVLDAIGQKSLIEKVDIFEKIKDPFFRFLTADKPILSSKVSEALSVIYREARTVNPKVQKMATEKLKENADDFAKHMYEVVKKIQVDEKISSYRETVKALNDSNVPSYRGGEWHVNTLQQLKKRWKELGLTPFPQPEK